MLFHPQQSITNDHHIQSPLPPPYTPGPYVHSQPSFGVPSLLSLCIQSLLPYPDQIHQLPVRLNLTSTATLRDFLPPLDPRAWAVLVQVFAALPSQFRTYTAPLADEHVPLLQSIPCRSDWCLVTVLELRACEHLTDDTIFNLKILRTLTAFDASKNTRLTPYAIKSLGSTLGDSLGPWQLRILSLRECTRITNDVYEHISVFPLLSVIDLRDTKCTRSSTSLTRFLPSQNTSLFHPTPLLQSLTTLQSIQPELHISASKDAYILHLNTLHHTPSGPAKLRTQPPPGTVQDSFVTLPPPSSKGRITTGHSDLLLKREKEQEDAVKHERNKDAWYQRNIEGIGAPKRVTPNTYKNSSQTLPVHPKAKVKPKSTALTGTSSSSANPSTTSKPATSMTMTTTLRSSRTYTTGHTNGYVASDASVHMTVLNSGLRSTSTSTSTSTPTSTSRLSPSNDHNNSNATQASSNTSSRSSAISTTHDSSSRRRKSTEDDLFIPPRPPRSAVPSSTSTTPISIPILALTASTSTSTSLIPSSNPNPNPKRPTLHRDHPHSHLSSTSTSHPPSRLSHLSSTSRPPSTSYTSTPTTSSGFTSQTQKRLESNVNALSLRSTKKSKTLPRTLPKTRTQTRTQTRTRDGDGAKPTAKTIAKRSQSSRIQMCLERERERGRERECEWERDIDGVESVESVKDVEGGNSANENLGKRKRGQESLDTHTGFRLRDVPMAEYEFESESGSRSGIQLDNVHMAAVTRTSTSTSKLSMRVDTQTTKPEQYTQTEPAKLARLAKLSNPRSALAVSSSLKASAVAEAAADADADDTRRSHRPTQPLNTQRPPRLYAQRVLSAVGSKGRDRSLPGPLFDDDEDEDGEDGVDYDSDVHEQPALISKSRSKLDSTQLESTKLDQSNSSNSSNPARLSEPPPPQMYPRRSLYSPQGRHRSIPGPLFSDEEDEVEYDYDADVHEPCGCWMCVYYGWHGERGPYCPLDCPLGSCEDDDGDMDGNELEHKHYFDSEDEDEDDDEVEDEDEDEYTDEDEYSDEPQPEDIPNVYVPTPKPPRAHGYSSSQVAYFQQSRESRLWEHYDPNTLMLYRAPRPFSYLEEYREGLKKREGEKREERVVAMEKRNGGGEEVARVDVERLKERVRAAVGAVKRRRLGEDMGGDQLEVEPETETEKGEGAEATSPEVNEKPVLSLEMLGGRLADLQVLELGFQPSSRASSRGTLGSTFENSFAKPKSRSRNPFRRRSPPPSKDPFSKFSIPSASPTPTPTLKPLSSASGSYTRIVPSSSLSTSASTSTSLSNIQNKQQPRKAGGFSSGMSAAKGKAAEKEKPKIVKSLSTPSFTFDLETPSPRSRVPGDTSSVKPKSKASVKPDSKVKSKAAPQASINAFTESTKTTSTATTTLRSGTPTTWKSSLTSIQMQRSPNESKKLLKRASTSTSSLRVLNEDANSSFSASMGANINANVKLVPISAFKIPVVSDEMRREHLAKVAKEEGPGQAEKEKDEEEEEKEGGPRKKVKLGSGKAAAASGSGGGAVSRRKSTGSVGTAKSSSNSKGSASNSKGVKKKTSMGKSSMTTTFDMKSWFNRPS
ncbi:hypothetical protein CPB83DRAFT_903454 [Crepidotus variabilis]|uniref:Uncharacterized protein n=1 Tax=Crepidotus variabilis TaxID=179855 RepID=A0A9P6EPM5_9AGAR|nr:hypothetical protein CPB83DRAFT_903454 [Crepidotus variabilis]